MTEQQNILIVDDREENLLLLERIISRLHVNVLTAEDGYEALELASQHRLSLALLDIHMPGMNGYELAERLRKQENNQVLPIIFLSAVFNDDHAIFQGYGAGAIDFISKPFNLKLLVSKVKVHLELDRHRMQQSKKRELEQAKRFLEEVLTSMPDPVFVLSLEDGHIRMANQAASSLLDWKVEELVGCQISKFFGQKKISQELRRLNESHQRNGFEKAMFHLETELLTRTHQAVPILLSGSLFQSPEEDALVVLVAKDIRERKQAEEALLKSEERYALAVRAAAEGLFDWDLHSDEIYLSPRWRSMLPEIVLSEHINGDTWYKLIDQRDRESVRGELESLLYSGAELFCIEYRLQLPTGGVLWVLCQGVIVRDERGFALRLVGSQTDITQKKEIKEKLLYDALHDNLTGLPNRMLMVSHLERAIAQYKRRDNYHFALLFLDLDGFKKVNDGLGHECGDRLLIEISKRISETLRPGDIIARFGGDEFLIFLDDLGHIGDAFSVVERIQGLASSPVLVDGYKLKVSASIGIVFGDENYQHPEEILRNADIAMYEAKRKGKDQYVIFDEQMFNSVKEALNMEIELRNALDRDELQLYYQPLVNLETGELTGVEALLRWNSKKLGFVSPGQFIPIAEDTGLIVPIGRWVIQEACRQLRQWQRDFHTGDSLTLSVNISGRQLCLDHFVPELEAILNESELRPDQLDLEITETFLIDNPKLASTKLKEIRNLGIGLHLDDFGTGYSSLSYLRNYPISCIKIDRSFTWELEERGKGLSIVRSIIQLADGLGLGTIAEGIETSSQLKMLQELGCSVGQGYFFAKPMSAKEIEERFLLFKRNQALTIVEKISASARI